MCKRKNERSSTYKFITKNMGKVKVYKIWMLMIM